MFNLDSQNGLLNRVVTLEEQVQLLTAQVEALREALANGGRTQGGLFHRKDDIEVVTVQVARDGNRVMYIPDREDPSIHHDVPVDRFLGRIEKIELQEGTVKGKPITYVVAHMKNGNQLVRLRLGNVGVPSGAVKSFLDNVSRIPDESLVKNVVFWPYPGTDDSVTMVSILDPETDKSFPYPEGRKKADWKNNDAYWQDLLVKTISRIDAIARVSSTSTVPPSPAAPTPQAKTPAPRPKPNETGGSATYRVGDEVSIVGSVVKPQDIEEWPDEEDPRITRSGLTFLIKDGSSDKGVSCQAFDDLARKVSNFYSPGLRLSCSGVRDLDENGNFYVLVQAIEPAITEPEQADPSVENELEQEPYDLGDLIAQTTIEMERVGWGQEEGREYLTWKFKKNSRKKLDGRELGIFLAHLKSLDSTNSLS